MTNKNNYTKIVITNSNIYTPSELAMNAYSYSLPINLKETCFGLVITGNLNDITFISNELRNLDKNNIFIKDRGFPAGDKRRCRTHRNGGSRPGFYNLYNEMKILSKISESLNNINSLLKSSAEIKDNNIDITNLFSIVQKYIKNYDNEIKSKENKDLI